MGQGKWQPPKALFPAENEYEPPESEYDNEENEDEVDDVDSDTSIADRSLDLPPLLNSSAAVGDLVCFGMVIESFNTASICQSFYSL